MSMCMEPSNIWWSSEAISLTLWQSEKRGQCYGQLALNSCDKSADVNAKQSVVYINMQLIKKKITNPTTGKSLEEIWK